MALGKSVKRLTALDSCATWRLNSMLWERWLGIGFHPSKSSLTGPRPIQPQGRTPESFDEGQSSDVGFCKETIVAEAPFVRQVAGQLGL